MWSLGAARLRGCIMDQICLEHTNKQMKIGEAAVKGDGDESLQSPAHSPPQTEGDVAQLPKFPLRELFPLKRGQAL